jgi:N-acetyl-anhydromuramyl-L-alanine amidase AmpD
MTLSTDNRSPNFTDTEIETRFVILHCTAVSLERTLKLFTSAESQVSSHLVIGTDGSVHELVPCLTQPALRAWHAGVSRVERDGQTVEGLNDFSIGIELENLNGNIFDYTDPQYQALSEVFAVLKERYPALQNADTVMGHEQVAGFRGKVDPGHCFDWSRFFQMCYPDQSAPILTSVLPPVIREAVVKLAEFAPSGKEERDDYFARLSSLTESAVAALESPEAHGD